MLLSVTSANLKGSAVRRFDRRCMTKRKEFRRQNRRAAICGRLPILASMRSYSGVQRSGMISARGLTIRREAIQQRQASKREASTCTTPNNVVNWRLRQSLMARREPQCKHFWR